MVSHPENGSDSPIGSNRDRGRDRSRHAPTTWALCARPAHAERTTCAGCAHDMRATWAL